MRIGAVVEGLGDRKAIPSLVSKTALFMQHQAFVVNIVECGGWGALKKEGGIERYARLVKAGQILDRVICAVDLDDHCPVTESSSIAARVETLQHQIGIPIQLCFFTREYETLFLHGLDGIRSRSTDVEWIDPYQVGNPGQLRDAKGTFSRAMKLPYRPSIDQDKFTKRLEIAEIIGLSRPLRRLASFITGKSNLEILAFQHP